MVLFLFLISGSLAWCLFVKLVLHKTVTWSEFAIQMFVAIVIAGMGVVITIPQPSYDVEILNGKVLEKYSEKVSCSHSYDCNPRRVCSGSGKDRSCRTVYDTCYEHFWDRSWRVKTSFDTHTVSRVDRRGLTEPEKWTAVKVGEPASDSSMYRSFVREVPEHFMSHITAEMIMKDYEGKIPTYPSKIYGMYKIDRLVQAGIKVPDAQAWNERTSEFLKERGAAKKVNLVTVFTNEKDQRFSQAIEAAWMGGKKNDVITIIGVEEWPKISWVRVLSWTESEYFKVATRDKLYAMENVDIDKYFTIMGESIDKDYTYSSMRRFEHLSNDRAPPLWAIVTAIILTVLANLVTTYIMHKNEF